MTWARPEPMAPARRPRDYAAAERSLSSASIPPASDGRASVTAPLPVQHEPGRTAVTADVPREHATGQQGVTCRRCGSGIPADHRFVVIASNNLTWGIRAGDPVCVDCANRAPLLLPWDGPHHWARYSGRFAYPVESYLHKCPKCGRQFYGAVQRTYCSARCAEDARAARRDRTIDRAPRACEVCGDTFTPQRSDGRYCTPACRQRAYRQRRANP